MAASLTISSATVAANGRTVTIVIAGASGALTPASAITGVRVRTTNSHNQASSAIASNTLTITLSSFIGAGETVTVDTIAGNITDGSGNTMVLATGQTATNNSTKAASFFAQTDPAVYITGALQAGSNFGRSDWRITTNIRQFDFVFTGTDLSLVGYQVFGGSLLVSIDGGAESSVAVTSLGTTEAASWYEVPIAAGLTDASHRVTIKQAAGSIMFAPVPLAGAFHIAGATPSIAAPTSGNTAIDVQGTHVPLKITTGFAVPSTSAIDNTAYIQPDDNWAFAISSQFTPTGSYDGQFAFKATCSTIKVFVQRSGKWTLEIDGTPHSVQVTTTPADLAYAWVTVATGLDATTEHSYKLGHTSSTGVKVYALQTLGGTGINLSNPMPTLRTAAYYGDSISVGFATTDPTFAHTWMMSTRSGVGMAIRGLAGTTVVASGSTAPRVAEVTSLAHLDRIVVLYGTNDAQAYYNSGGTPNATYSPANFYTAFYSMLDQLTQSGTGTAKLDVWAILIPGWGGAIDTLVAAQFNPQIQAAVAALKAAYPAKASLYRYVNSANFIPAGSSVHPTDAGSINIADRGLPFILDNAYTLGGPSSGLVGAVSPAFTVALASGARFNGTETITISDGGQGGTITPSVGSPGTSTAAVTPADGATSFTFTYSAASGGTKTITPTNAQGWPNPTALPFAAQGLILASGFFAA